MDAAFDDLGESLDSTSPFEADPETTHHREDAMILEGLDEVLKELTDSKPETTPSPEFSPASSIGEPKATLNPDDIEALFEE